MLAGIGRGHADDAEKRRRRHRPVVQAPHISVELPEEALAVRRRLTPGTRHHLVDVYDERLPRFGAAHLEGPFECVPRALGMVRLVDGIPFPAGVSGLEDDRLTRVDRYDRFVLAGEPPFHERGSWIHASAGASSTRSPIRRP